MKYQVGDWIKFEWRGLILEGEIFYVGPGYYLVLVVKPAGVEANFALFGCSKCVSAQWNYCTVFDEKVIAKL